MQIAAGATAIGLLLGWYVVSQIEGGASFAYYRTLDEYRAAGAAPDRFARVHGYVAIDSIERDVAARRVRFSIVNRPPHAGGDLGAPLDVVYASLEVPDMFKDGAEVVVEGRLDADSVFRADKVMAKCPSKFEADPTQQASF
jgi:cytochrome c-type biogenesis protein CcmE